MLLTYNDFKNIISESLKKIINNGNENEIDIIRIFNLNDIPIDEIRYQYRDLSFTVSSSGYGGRFMGNNGQIINEDINSTLSIDETKNEIQSKFKFKDWQFTTQMGANGIELIVLYPGIFKNTSLINRLWKHVVGLFLLKDGLFSTICYGGQLVLTQCFKTIYIMRP